MYLSCETVTFLRKFKECFARFEFSQAWCLSGHRFFIWECPNPEFLIEIVYGFYVLKSLVERMTFDTNVSKVRLRLLLTKVKQNHIVILSYFGLNYNFLWYYFFSRIYIIITYYVIFFRFTFFFLTKRGAVYARLHPFFAVSAPKNSVLFLLFFLKKSCHSGTLFWHYDFVIFSHCIDVFQSGGLRSRTLDHPTSSWKLFAFIFIFAVAVL